MARIAVNIDLLKQYMKEKDMSPASLAGSMGVSRATVSRVLRAKRGAGAEFIGRLIEAHPDVWDKGVIFLDTYCQTATNNSRLAKPGAEAVS